MDTNEEEREFEINSNAIQQIFNVLDNKGNIISKKIPQPPPTIQTPPVLQQSSRVHQAQTAMNEMLNDSFSLHPNETAPDHYPANNFSQEFSNEFVVVNKEEMLPPQQLVHSTMAQKEGTQANNDSVGGDQFNQSFGPENSY